MSGREFSGPILLPPPQTGDDGGSIWSARYVWVTLGAFALLFLAALQSLAVTTVMPAVSDALDGEALYAVAFSGTLATSVIGMVAAGAWADRTGPAAPLYAAVALFVAGLVIDALAPSMGVLVLGRLVMGLGTGGQIVALNVVVARIFPPRLHGRVFAAFSAAWIVPSLIGPFLAGAVAEFLHWRWVFGGVAVFAVAALAMIAPRLRDVRAHVEEPAAEPVARRLLLAAVVAAAALVLALAGELPGAWSWLVAAAALAVVGLFVLPLLPRGTLRAARGLPSVILMRGLMAGALFGAEIYVPKLLIDDFQWTPTWAGLGLTVAALAWAAGAEISGRHGDRIGNRRLAVLGVVLLAAAVAGVGATGPLGLPALWAALVWGLAGLGMGLMYPRLSVLMLAYSTARNQGFNSSALQISDSVGSSATIAVMGLVFTALAGTTLGFPAVFAIAAALALAALVPGMRLGTVREL